MSDDKKVIFSMVKVNKTTPTGKHILKDIYLSFFYGAKIGIIGNNGAGKSTVMKIIAGLDEAFQGDVVWADGYTVGYLSQEPELDESKTVREIVEEGTQEIVDVLKEYEEINMKFMDEEILNDPDKMQKLMDRQAAVQDKIDALDAWELDTKLSIAMDALRCPPDDQKISELSGGERRRVALCRLLLQQPDVLLLDEPTNHLDAESIDWLEQHLEHYKGTVLCVTHDRYFLDNVAGWILELDRGEGIPYEGNYASWLEQKSKRLAQEEKHESKRRKELDRELDWIRQSPKGRRAKNKARINNYESMLAEGTKEKDARLNIPIPNGPRLGNKVIEASGLTKAFGDKLLVENLTFQLPPAGIVGIIGPNGAGKTTLFRMIMGEETPDDGNIDMGETVKIGYVDQRHADIDPNKTVWEKDGECMVLLGVENWGKGFRQSGDLGKALEGSGAEDAFTVLMSHDPTHYELAIMNDQAPVELTLSGHTHGMQMGIEIPWLGIKWSPSSFTYKRWGGLYLEGQQYLHVNRGFGVLGFPGRVGMPPEITVLTLVQGSPEA